MNPENLMYLGFGIAGAGIFANTSLDREVQDRYNRNVQSSGTDDVSKVLRQPGEVFLTVPLLIGSYAFFSDTPVGDWSQRSLRALAVGGPSTLFLRSAMGGAAPSDGDSDWRPFHDRHGVSGHAFIGAVPFMTAAGMNENLYAKTSLYAISALPALSRINDNAHYFSQAALGWYIAYLSCNAVGKSSVKGGKEFSLYPVLLSNNGFALVGTMTF